MIPATWDRIVGGLEELDAGHELMVGGVCETGTRGLNKKGSEGDECAEEVQGDNLGKRTIRFRRDWSDMGDLPCVAY